MIFKREGREEGEGPGGFPRGLLGVVLIFCVTFIAYFPALKSGFIWDDDGYVTKQAFRTLHGLWRIWFDVGATEGYYPLMHSAFWVEHRLWGDAPFGYHLVNVFLHATAACLLGMALRRLRVPGAGFAALIFALHPVCVESVAWVAEQKNVLSVVFYLLAALAYLRFDESRRRPLYFLAFGLFALALLSKTLTATLPAGILLMFWWRRGRLSWKGDVLPLIPWFAVGASAGLFSAWVERVYFGAEGSSFDLNLVQRVVLAGRVLWFYIGKLLWPANLIFIYPRWQIDAGDGWQWLFPLSAVAVAAALILLRKRARGVLVAYLFFAGTLFPTMGFLNIYGFVYSYVADHWQYLPSIGIIALAAAGLEKIRADRNLPSRPVRIFQGLLLAVLALLTWNQCGLYADMDTFYRTTLAKNPDCWLVHNNLGNALVTEGRVQEGIAHYEEALRLQPKLADAHNNLGIALAETGRMTEAQAEFEQAVRLAPGFVKAHTNLANALRLQGRLPEAIAEGEHAVRLQPDYAFGQNNLGAALGDAGRFPEAIAHYQEAVRLDPGFAEAYYNLGVAYAEIGQMTPAIAGIERALQLKPEYNEAHESLGRILCAIGRNEEGMAHLREADRIKAKQH